jgi:hypothetical protein
MAAAAFVGLIASRLPPGWLEGDCRPSLLAVIFRHGTTRDMLAAARPGFTFTVDVGMVNCCVQGVMNYVILRPLTTAIALITDQ